MKGIADYTFVRHLRDGNHGAFWLAEPPQRLGRADNELITVKTLAKRASDADYRRMANELRVYALVSSPDLVEVIDAGHDRGRLFYAMPHFPDGSLAAPARSMQRHEIVSAIAAAARAADELHGVGIAHRDIRPANILLDGGRGRLADLGLAQIVDPEHAATGIGPVGTIEFLAPELVRGHPASRASDIWALGVTLHTVLSNRPLYQMSGGGSLIEALRHVLDDGPVIDETIGEPLTSILRRCFMTEPADRFSTAADLAGALQGATT